MLPEEFMQKEIVIKINDAVWRVVKDSWLYDDGTIEQVDNLVKDIVMEVCLSLA